nr:PREDICTED: uncharacterized protein LOC105676981 [Linepithema humile]
MSLSIATRMNVWDYYMKLPNLKAQCKFCENRYDYITPINFQRHIETQHQEIWKYEEKRKLECYLDSHIKRIHSDKLKNMLETCNTVDSSESVSLHQTDTMSLRHVGTQHPEIWKYEEERKLMKWPWMYFKYLNNLYSQCVICCANILSTSECVKDHLNSHSEEQQKNYYIYRVWPWKYCTQRGDFIVKCNICCNNLSLSVCSHLDSHIKKMHSDKLKIMQETHNTVNSSKHVSSFEMDPMSLKDSCIEISNFWVHIKEMHKKIFNLEEKFRSLHGPSRTYFKYFNSMTLMCIICNKNVLFLSECLEDHLYSHSREELIKHTFHHWLWKYCEKKNNFVVECDICHNNFFLSNETPLDHE